MYTLIRTLSAKRFTYEQVPTLTASWLIAEFFYKFGSFTLECAAFLATWCTIDAFVQMFVRRHDDASVGRADRGA